MMSAPKRAQSRIRVMEESWMSSLGDHVQDLAWSPDGRLLAAAEVSGKVAVLDAVNGNLIFKVQAHALGCCSLAWKPREAVLATGGQDGKVKLWDGATGREITTLSESPTWVEKVAWSPDGRFVAYGAGKILKIASLAGGIGEDFPPLASTIADLAWKPDGSELAVACYGGVTLFEPEKHGPGRKYEWKGSCLNLAWHPEGKYLAGGQQDGCVHFWRTKDGKDSTMHGYPTKVRELAWDFTGRYLATGGSAEVTVWDCSGKGPAGTRPISLEGHSLPISALEFRPRRIQLASGGRDGHVVIWDLKTRKALGKAVLPEGVTRLAWNADGSRLAVGDEQGTLAVLDGESL